MYNGHKCGNWEASMTLVQDLGKYIWPKILPAHCPCYSGLECWINKGGSNQNGHERLVFLGYYIWKFIEEFAVADWEDGLVSDREARPASWAVAKPPRETGDLPRRRILCRWYWAGCYWIIRRIWHNPPPHEWLQVLLKPVTEAMSLPEGNARSHKWLICDSNSVSHMMHTWTENCNGYMVISTLWDWVVLLLQLRARYIMPSIGIL